MLIVILLATALHPIAKYAKSIVRNILSVNRIYVSIGDEAKLFTIRISTSFQIDEEK